MKIVFVSQWFSEKMGYIENCLPFAMAQFGHEIHLVTSTAQVYFYQKHFKESYGTYLGEPIVKTGTYTLDSVTIYRLPFWHRKNIIYTRGLKKIISDIQPDIIHALDFESIDTFRLATYKNKLRYKLFTAQHAGYSVYPVARNWGKLNGFIKLGWYFLKILPGQYISKRMETCFCVTTDAAEVGVKFMGIAAQKIEIATLGVNTHLFKPISAEIKKSQRQVLGFSDDTFLCIYSGRFTEVKQPLVIAQAIAKLKSEGIKIDGLFIGAGEQRESIENLGFKVIALQPYHLLPHLYGCADCAVWAGEESTSQLDCVASGLNLVLTDKITAYDLTSTEKLRSDNLYRPRIVTRFFKNGDVLDLAENLKFLVQSKEFCVSEMKKGLEEIQTKYSWKFIAQERLNDYSNSLLSDS